VLSILPQNAQTFAIRHWHRSGCFNQAPNSVRSENLAGKTKCVAAAFHPSAKGGKIQTAILGVMLVLRRDYDRVFRNKTRTDKTQRSGWLRRETD